jgi:hypothetical protein
VKREPDANGCSFPWPRPSFAKWEGRRELKGAVITQPGVENPLDAVSLAVLTLLDSPS